MCHWKGHSCWRSHVGDHSLCGVYTYATFSSWISTLRTAHIHEKRGSFEGGQFPFNASVAFSWRRFIMFIQGFVGSKGYCSKFKSLRLWDETWGLCNMPRTPLISSLISCLNSSSSGLANSWHSSITDSSQTTIRFPPRPNDCLSWFCWIKNVKTFAADTLGRSCNIQDMQRNFSCSCTSTCMCTCCTCMYYTSTYTQI